MSRQHRELFVMKLIDRNLHNHGLISCNKIWYHGWDSLGVPQEVLDKAGALLPLVVDDADFNNNKAMHINGDIYQRSWISVITETHAFDEDHNLFISEKLWKPIWALQPFMVWGHRGTLAQLRSWGFETYQCLWDESYDSADDLDRMELVLQNLQDLCMIKDRLGLVEQARERCEHNQQHFMRQDWFNSMYYQRFMAAYNGLNS